MATGDALGWAGGVAFRGGVVGVCTVGTDFGVPACGVDMAEFLTFVAADGLVEVFVDGDDRAGNVDMFFEKVVGIFREGADNF